MHLRWFRFRLATLLAVIAALCAWLSGEVNRTRNQRIAIDAIRAIGGSITLNEYPQPGSTQWKTVLHGPRWLRWAIGDAYFDRVTSVSIHSRRRGVITPAHIEYLTMFRELRALSLSGPISFPPSDLGGIEKLVKLESLALLADQIDDANIQQIGRLREIRRLSLGKTRVSDKGLIHLSELRRIEVLLLGRTQVNGSGLRHLQRLPNLRVIGLEFTEVKDNSLKYLEQLRSLERVCLDDTLITDAGLGHLKRMTWLKEISVEGTAITESGLDDLRRSMPNTTIFPESMLPGKLLRERVP